MAINRSEAALCSGAALALVAGTALYLGARGAHPWLPALAPWTGPLPTLLHTAAFVALTLAATRPWPRHALLAGAAWVLLEGGFEVLQIDPLARAMQARIGGDAPLLRAHLEGTFDPLDLLAALAGAALAVAFARAPGSRAAGRAR
jgi:hypothetical protein